MGATMICAYRGEREEEEKEDEERRASTTHCKPLGWTGISLTLNPRRLLHKQPAEKMRFSCRNSCVAKHGKLLSQDEFYVLLSIFLAIQIGSVNWFNGFQ